MSLILKTRHARNKNSHFQN